MAQGHDRAYLGHVWVRRSHLEGAPPLRVDHRSEIAPVRVHHRGRTRPRRVALADPGRSGPADRHPSEVPSRCRARRSCTNWAPPRPRISLGHYAEGVEHALMWAQLVTPAPPEAPSTSACLEGTEHRTTAIPPSMAAAPRQEAHAAVPEPSTGAAGRGAHRRLHRPDDADDPRGPRAAPTGDAARAGGGQPRASPSSACHPVALSSYDQVVSPASAGSGVVVRSCRLSADAQRGPGLPAIHLIVDVREPEGDVVCDGHQAGAVHPDLPPQLDAGLGVVAGAQRQLSLAARPSHASPTPWSRSAFTSSPAVARIGSERGGRCTRAPSSLEHASRAKKRVGMEIRTHRVSPPRDRVTRLHWPTDVRTAFRRLCQVAGV
jgi:hypothetical protein